MFDEKDAERYQWLSDVASEKWILDHLLDFANKDCLDFAIDKELPPNFKETQ